MIFPINTSITFRTVSSVYRLTNITYNPLNSTLTMFQSLTSLNRFQDN